MAIAQQHNLYVECIRKQLEEVDLLSSIYCAPGEMQIFDAGVVSDFNEYLDSAETILTPTAALRACLDYTIRLPVLQNVNAKHKLDVRIELPHLYPALEHAIVTIHSPLLSKAIEADFRAQIAAHILTLAKENSGITAETYVFQIIAWIQEHIDDVIKGKGISVEGNNTSAHCDDKQLVIFERLWIYSHHIKSKTKRQEIMRQSHCLKLSGFSRPGKPGIICVEGLQEHTQEFWRIIKSMRWQKISICKSEVKHEERSKVENLRRFNDFKEQLFCDDVDNKDSVMNMGQFIKYLEAHNSGYMKKELFGLE